MSLLLHPDMVMDELRRCKEALSGLRRGRPDDMPDCPALHAVLEGYPFPPGRVPYKIRALHTVTPDPLPSVLMDDTEVRATTCELGGVYVAWTNSLGAVVAHLHGGRKLGMKPGEFEVITWLRWTCSRWVVESAPAITGGDL